MSPDTAQLRVAESTGSQGRELIAVASNEINAVRISGDGETILFRIYRDTSFREGRTFIERGIYMIQPDGSDLQQIVGPAEMMPLLGVPHEEVPFFDGRTIDLSANGQQIVFGMFIEPEAGGLGQGLFTVERGGTPQLVIERTGFILNTAISPDGITVAYTTQAIDTGTQEAGVMSFNGSDRRALTNSTTEPSGIGLSLPIISQGRLTLNSDGSRLLLGKTGILVDTRTGDMLALAALDRSYLTGDPRPLVGESLPLATMDRNAQRVLYLALDDVNLNQLVVVDLNPSDLGEAPSITDAVVDPPSIALAGASSARLTATVTTRHPFVRVGMVTLLEGRADLHVGSSGPLADDGVTSGDQTANGGVFTTNRLSSDCCAVPGPRVLRIKAETKSPDSVRHATAVSVRPLQR